jgi:hypothetical protein
MRGNMLKLVQNDPFCSLIVRIMCLAENDKVVRLRRPCAMILGLDQLTVHYLNDLFETFANLTTIPRYGSLLNLMQWDDTMPTACVGTSNPIIKDLLNQLIDQPIIIHPGLAPHDPAKVTDMHLTIDQGGAHWDFMVDGSHYMSTSIPKSVFTTAHKRYQAAN